MIPTGGLEASKVRETEGWISLRKKSGAYDDPDLVTSLSLPYVDGGVWPHIARMFDFALQEMDLRGDEIILDIGAGQGWACRYFAAKDCRAIAIDIDADELYGLGKAWAIMEHAGVYFEPVLADGENLPFFSNKFDVVFFSAALHHFEEFGKVLRQAYKVLKPGGLIIGAGEPSVSVFTPEQEVQASLPEAQEGITERRPKAFEYWWCLRRVGFKATRIDTFETYNASPVEIYRWIAAVRRNLPPAVRLRYRPLIWLVLSFLLVFRVFPCEWAGLLTLHINGGNLFMRAVKPTK